jgi:hypothetical protein
MNPPDQPTQPSETHKQLAADVFRMVHNRDLTAAAQLIADSEARAVDGAMRDTPWAANYVDMERELAAEREKVRVLREALSRRHDEQSYHCQYVDDALAATEEKP